MASALLAIPWFLIVYVMGNRQALETKLAESVLLVVGTALFVWLITMLRKLLRARHGFVAADVSISLLIKGTIVITVIGLLGLFSTYLESSVAIVTVIIAIPLGVVQIRFGRALLTLPHDLNGMRNPYAYLTMITGFCQAVIFLMPIALFTSAVADVMLGTIFLHAAAGMRKEE